VPTCSNWWAPSSEAAQRSSRWDGWTLTREVSRRRRYARFATAEGTARQRGLARAAGQPSIYTPQVRVNGRDLRAGVALPAPQPSALRLTLTRDGDDAPLAKLDRYLTAQGAETPGGTAIHAPTAIWGGHAQFHRAGFRLRGLVAGPHMADPIGLHEIRGLTRGPTGGGAREWGGGAG